MIFKEEQTIDKDTFRPIMTYYTVLRNTIHGMDRIMVNMIYQSIALITGALTLSMVCFDKIGTEPLKTLMAIGLTVLAFFLTWNSKKRITLYVDIQKQAIIIAKEIEERLIKPEVFARDGETVSFRLTHNIEDNVAHAGIKGESIYKWAIKVFYVVELGFIIIYLINSIQFYQIFFNFLGAIFPKFLLFIIRYLYY